jgi:hypothetical protein
MAIKKRMNRYPFLATCPTNEILDIARMTPHGWRFVLDSPCRRPRLGIVVNRHGIEANKMGCSVLVLHAVSLTGGHDARALQHHLGSRNIQQHDEIRETCAEQTQGPLAELTGTPEASGTEFPRNRTTVRWIRGRPRHL